METVKQLKYSTYKIMENDGGNIMEFKITETEKYKGLVQNQSSVIELAKVEAQQEIAQQLALLNESLAQELEAIEKGIEILNRNVETMRRDKY